jgi:NADPH:quinone reductase-like Zn-dependent oxidoreductase
MAGPPAQARPDRPVLQAVAGPPSTAPFTAAAGQARRVAIVLYLGLIHRSSPTTLTDRLGANLDGMRGGIRGVPEHLSFEEAATLPCAGDSMGRANGPSPGNRGRHGLTQGSGGVAVFALQFARLLGARVIAMTSTAEKAERLKALGASDVINYSETPDWDAKARELTDGRGIDCVVGIGGPGTIAMSLAALAVGGHVSLIWREFNSIREGARSVIADRPITFRSIGVGSRADFEAMNRAIAMHRLHPVIDRTFPFTEAKDASRHFEGRGHFGKVVIAHARELGWW